MVKEYEYSFIGFDRKNIIDRIKKLGGIKKGTFLFRVMMLSHPKNKPDTHLRVRDEGHRVTMTYKYNMDQKFVNENEVCIDNYKSGIGFLKSIGCDKKFYYEKIREIWILDDSEIVFDTMPAKPDKIEVESNSKEQLDKVLGNLGLKVSDGYVGKDPDIYEEYFGISKPDNIDITFENVEKVLGPLVKKNKKEFEKLIKFQKEYYYRVTQLPNKL